MITGIIFIIVILLLDILHALSHRILKIFVHLS